MMGSAISHQLTRFLRKGKSMTAIVTSGIDLANNVFAIHGINPIGKAVVIRHGVPRAGWPTRITFIVR
jgi:hypothetical protein